MSCPQTTMIHYNGSILKVVVAKDGMATYKFPAESIFGLLTKLAIHTF